MSNISATIVKNIQELLCLLDNDFNNYKDILDQVTADIVKNSKHTEAFVTFVNSQLANAPTRKKGVTLLQSLLPLCPQEFLEENAIAWLNNSLKNCQYEATIHDEAYKVIKPLLEICNQTPELNKSITSGIIGKILENITKINYNNEEAFNALKCLETCLRIYPGSCVPYKSSIENFLLSFVDCGTSLTIVRSAGKCLHLFQQIGGGGAQGVNYKEAWKNQQLVLCATMQSIMDSLFESIMEMEFVQQENASLLNLPNLPSTGEPIRLNSNRLINLSIFLQEMLLGAFPTAKCVSPNTILNIISRGLAVTSATLGNQLINYAINLSTHLFFIHKHLLHLMQALIISLGFNLIPFAATIVKSIINSLKSTKPKDAGNVKPFCDLRLTAYKTLSLWMTTTKSASCVHTIADSLITIILTDVTPVTTEINLTVQSVTPKHTSKKAKKKLQQEQIIQSSVAKNYSPITKKMTNSSNIYQIKICAEAFETLQTILINSGHFLKPVVHKHLQEFVIKMILNIQRDIILNPYDNVNCKISLYKTLTILVTSHHWNISPPLSYAIHLLSKGQSDTDHRVSSCCTTSLVNLNNIVHPSGITLEFPINIEKLKIEFNLEQDKDKKDFNSDSEKSDEMEITELVDDDETEVSIIENNDKLQEKTDNTIEENLNRYQQLKNTTETKRIDKETEEHINSDSEKSDEMEITELVDDEISESEVSIIENNDKLQEKTDNTIEENLNKYQQLKNTTETKRIDKETEEYINSDSEKSDEMEITELVDDEISESEVSIIENNDKLHEKTDKTSDSNFNKDQQLKSTTEIKNIDKVTEDATETEENSRKKAKIGNGIDTHKDITKNSVKNGIEVEIEDSDNDQINISDDEMDQLILEDEPEIISVTKNENKTKADTIKKDEQSEDEIIDLVDEDMLSSFVDIVNE